MVQMRWFLIFCFLSSIIFITSSLVSAVDDSQLPQMCGGDSELAIGCLGDEELTFLAGIAPEEGYGSGSGGGAEHTTTPEEEELPEEEEEVSPFLTIFPGLGIKAPLEVHILILVVLAGGLFFFAYKRGKKKAEKEMKKQKKKKQKI